MLRNKIVFRETKIWNLQNRDKYVVVNRGSWAKVARLWEQKIRWKVFLEIKGDESNWRRRRQKNIWVCQHNPESEWSKKIQEEYEYGTAWKRTKTKKRRQIIEKIQATGPRA